MKLIVMANNGNERKYRKKIKYSERERSNENEIKEEIMIM